MPKKHPVDSSSQIFVRVEGWSRSFPSELGYELGNIKKNACCKLGLWASERLEALFSYDVTASDNKEYCNVKPWIPVRIGSPPEIAAAANAARPTDYSLQREAIYLLVDST